MMVLGADTHKRSHTIAAVAAGTGELPVRRRSRSAPAGSGSCSDGRAGWPERVWALEDCRHVAGSLSGS